MAFDPISIGILGATSIAGALLGRQKAPQVAPIKDLNVGEAAGEAIAANRNNYGAATALSRNVNDFNQTEATRLLERAIPGFSKLQARLLTQINSDLDSQNSLPKDMQDRIARFAAEKGITRGTAGSNFDGLNLVKDFGFNLVDWNNAQRARALNTLSTVFGMAPRVNPMSPMAMFVDPNTAIQAKAQNNANQQAVQQGAFNASAAAANANRSALGGAIQGVGTLAALYAMGRSGAPAPVNAGYTTPD